MKYQSITCQLFSVYSVATSLMDKLFRQAAARNKQRTLRWDAEEEDLLVWCITNPPFWTRQQPSANPHIGTSTEASATHTGATSGCLAWNTHTIRCGDLPEVQPWKVHQGNGMCLLPQVLVTGCHGEHTAKACPLQLLGLCELQCAHMPLRHSF